VAAKQSIRVSLVNGPAAGAFFLEDLCAMLRALAVHSGNTLEFVGTRPSASGVCQSWVAEAHSLESGLVRRELGLHRAQFVPMDSSTGRIETIVACVEFVTDAASEERAGTTELVRTFNYPLRTCTHHPSGRGQSLDAVLAGEAG
jgi:protein subunit release factor A